MYSLLSLSQFPSVISSQDPRRISKGNTGHSSKGPITLLRDGDQPFIFDIRFFNKPYRFEFYDTASPQNWKLLEPNLIVLCYDISSRLSLINMQRLVILVSSHGNRASLIRPHSGSKKSNIHLLKRISLMART